MAKRVFFNLGRQLNRRTMLRGMGVSLGLPWLSAMQRALAAPMTEPPRRFVAMTLGLGLYADNLFPEQPGAQYKPSRYLKKIDDLRDQFTVVSGASHPGVTGGHTAEASILSANPMSNSSNSRNTISLDQHLARNLGGETRFPSMVLASSGASSPSYTANGSMITPLTSPARLYAQMFIDDSPRERERQAHRVRQGRSILDLVHEDAQRLQRELGSGDRDRLDFYFSGVRDLEQRLAESEAWALRPKPQVDAPQPVDVADPNDFVGRQRLMNDMIRLALQTDSSRFIVYHLGTGSGVTPIPGVSQGYHSLSHHGRDEEKLDQLAIVEEAIMEAWGDFLRGLLQCQEGNASLLDQTSVLLTSNLGNASSHDNRNMPVVLAGGGFRHGNHLAFDRKNNYPLPNLYVSVMQRLGLEQDTFSTSTGTMTGLELA